MADRNRAEDRAHLLEVMKEFDTAMLVTSTREGELRARPLAVAQVKPEGTVVFPTSARSAKVDELERDNQVGITMQDGKRFVSLSGHARVSRDRAEIDRLWKETWKVWFEEGKTDPDLVLLEVDPVRAEYWDNTGTKGLRYLFEAAKSMAGGDRPETTREQNAKVKL